MSHHLHLLKEDMFHHLHLLKEDMFHHLHLLKEDMWTSSERQKTLCRSAPKITKKKRMYSNSLRNTSSSFNDA